MSQESHIRIGSESVEQTLEIGRTLGGCLQGGDVLGLTGPLGAGKTRLVKGIALGLGVEDDRQVCSPTFVLVNEYAGREHLYHLDAYRLGHATELEALGFDEMCGGGGVVAVEWADRVAPALPADALWIDLSVTGETGRQLLLRTASASFARRLAQAGLDRWQQAGDKKVRH